MKPNEKTEYPAQAMSQSIPAITPEQPVQVITQAYVEQQLVRLFHALSDATGDPATAVDIVEKIADGIEADPVFSKQILTPDNIEKAYALKAKSDAKTISVTEVEKAFPALVEMIPFWSMLRNFMP